MLYDKSSIILRLAEKKSYITQPVCNQVMYIQWRKAGNGSITEVVNYQNQQGIYITSQCIKMLYSLSLFKLDKFIFQEVIIAWTLKQAKHIPVKLARYTVHMYVEYDFNMVVDVSNLYM